MESFILPISEYLLDPNSVWIIIGYTLLALLSSIALYDFGVLRISKHSKFKVVFIHYTVLGVFFGFTAFLLEVSTHGLTLKTAVNFCFLLIKLFIAFFASTILYKLVKDYFIVWALKKISDWTGRT